MFTARTRPKPNSRWQQRLVPKLKGDLRHELLTWDARSKLIGEFRQQVIVYPVLHRAQDDDGPRVVNLGGNKE